MADGTVDDQDGLWADGRFGQDIRLQPQGLCLYRCAAYRCKYDTAYRHRGRLQLDRRVFQREGLYLRIGTWGRGICNAGCGGRYHDDRSG